MGRAPSKAEGAEAQRCAINRVPTRPSRLTRRSVALQSCLTSYTCALVALRWAVTSSAENPAFHVVEFQCTFVDPQKGGSVLELAIRPAELRPLAC